MGSDQWITYTSDSTISNGDGTYSIPIKWEDGASTTIAFDWRSVGVSGNSIYWNKPKRREGYMTLYKVYCVDIRHCVVTSEHTRIGKDVGDAGIGLELSEAEKALREKDELEMIWTTLGEFKKLGKQRVVIDKE